MKKSIAKKLVSSIKIGWADIVDECDRLAVKDDIDWDRQMRIYTFEDGSRIYMSENECKALKRKIK